jgi:hypothetical protein
MTPVLAALRGIAHWALGGYEPDVTADGARFGHIVLKRHPDGVLYGFIDAPKKKTVEPKEDQ